MTKRSRFLRTALQCIEEKDGAGLHDLAIDLDADVVDSSDLFTEEDSRVLNELGRALYKNMGNRLAQERTRLQPAPSFSTAEIVISYCGRLSPKAKKLFSTATAITTFEKTLDSNDPDSEATPKTQQMDALDCHYASQVIEKLDAIVDRASRLDRLPLASVPDESVQRYFQETHDCYLYGFNTACVAMCRAILESALEEVIPVREREGKNVIGMVDVAEQNGLLTADRAAWAREVYRAGNLAIHKYQKFQKQYQPAKLEEIFGKARAVVEALYGAHRAQGHHPA